MVNYRLGLIALSFLYLTLCPQSTRALDLSSELTESDIEALVEHGELAIDEEADYLLMLAARCNSNGCGDQGCAKTSTVNGVTYQRKCTETFGGGDDPSSSNCKCLWHKQTTPPPSPTPPKNPQPGSGSEDVNPF